MTNTKCWQAYGTTGTLIHCWGECKMIYIYFTRKSGNFLTTYTYPVTQHFCFCPEKWKHVHKKNYMRTFMSNLLELYKIVNSPVVSPFTTEWLNKLRYIHTIQHCLAINRTNYCCTQQRGWISKTCLLKKPFAKEHKQYDFTYMKF